MAKLLQHNILPTSYNNPWELEGNDTGSLPEQRRHGNKEGDEEFDKWRNVGSRRRGSDLHALHDGKTHLMHAISAPRRASVDVIGLRTVHEAPDRLLPHSPPNSVCY